MKRLLIFPLLAISLFAQSGGSYVSIIRNIPLSTFQLGPGTSLVTLPDGTQAIEAAYKSAFSVDLGVSPSTLQADPTHPGNPGYSIDGRYELTFDIAAALVPYPGFIDVEVSYGTQQLCESYGWWGGNSTRISVPCLSPKYLIHQALPNGGPGQGTSDLVISGSNPGWPLDFKNFSLKFTPQ